nr:SEC23-interacting protein-like isoform X4 [Cherax quadricarinatus]
MATDTPVNPLLVSANTSSTFDGFQSAAVLVPPRISEAVSNEEALEQSGSVPTLPDATAVGKTQTLGSQFQELYTGETAVAGAMHSLSLVSPGSSTLRRPRSKYVVQQPGYDPLQPSPCAVSPRSPPATSTLSPPLQTNIPYVSPSLSYPSPFLPLDADASANANVLESFSSILSPSPSAPFAASPVDTGLSSVNLGEKFSEAASSPPPSTSPRASFVQSDNSSVIPPSFETMRGLTPKMLPWVTPEIPPRVTPEIPPQATNSVISGSVYHPVIYHWFYGVGRPQVWRPFSFADSFNLEEAFLQDSTELVPTEGGRYDVNVKERTRRAVYWEQDEPCPIRRCSWFKKSPLDAQPLPYDEQIAEQLEVSLSLGHCHLHLTCLCCWTVFFLFL